MKLVYRSPKLFKHAGVYLGVFGKFYRLVKIGEH